MWKLNTSILPEEAYVEKITKFLSHATAHPLRASDLLLWWETIFKPGIRRVTQDYCRRRAELIRSTRAFYSACLGELALEVGEREGTWAEFQSLREKAAQWDLCVLQGARVRSRLVSAGDADDPSVFHLAKEAVNGSRSCVETLTLDGQHVATTPAEVDEMLTQHFQCSFSRQIPTEAGPGVAFLEGVRGKAQLPLHFDCPYSLGELTEALHSLPKNSSPGDDGLPCEFYLAFWPLVGPIFLDMFLEVLRRGTITNSQGNALIRLIPKVEMPLKPTDYRPISLLNCDYKLMASTLAGRLKKTLDKTLGAAQRGGVPGRKIVDNLSLYRDAIAFMEERTELPSDDLLRDPVGPAGAVVGIDLEKAYDLVDRATLWSILSTMGFPEDFIGHLKTLYSVATMSVLNGSRVAGRVQCQSSVRQGCPLSIHLFVLYLEPLLVRLSSVLKGIHLLRRRLVARAYVDDVAVFVDSDVDLLALDAILCSFCAWTGARVNRVKTKALGLGKWAGRVRWPLPWLQTASPLTLLGIPFTSSISETSDRVWASTVGHLHGILKNNISRRFTLFQRVNFIKSEAVSRTVYVGQVLKCPPETVSKIQSAISTFLWSGRLERPQPAISCRPASEGGLGMVNVGLFLQALFVRPILSSFTGPDSVHRDLLLYWLAYPTRDFLPFYLSVSSPLSFFVRPIYLAHVPLLARQLAVAHLFGPTGPRNHRLLYQFWLRELSIPGVVETSCPSYDWPSIWRCAATLPHDVRETFFLFNHRLLFTRVRAHRLVPENSPLCLLCKNLPETDIHLLIECPEKLGMSSWLHSSLVSLGCSAPLADVIRGNLGPGPVSRKVFTLIAAYVHILWKNRPRKKPTTVDEIQFCWTRLQAPPNVQSCLALELLPP